MQRTAFLCAAFAFAVLGSPVAAQQTQPDQSSQQQSTPEQQTAPEQPAPFPPMPKARPSHRFVNVGGELRARHAARHRAVHEGRRERAHHERTRAHHKAAPQLSRKMVRKCHAMSYREIMRSDSCRALIKQELGASERHAKHRHEGSHRRHHRTKHRRD